MPPRADQLTRLVLVERRDTVAPLQVPRDPMAAKVRRYRLARMQLAGRTAAVSRHEHLRRMYD